MVISEQHLHGKAYKMLQALYEEASQLVAQLQLEDYTSV